MDAIEMAIYHADIDIFALVASDNGYYPLALRLRELGKRVIGIGDKQKCNPIWVNACNEFSYFEDLEENDVNILLQPDEQNDIDDFKMFSLEKFLEQAFDSTPPYKDTERVLLSKMCESVYALKSDFNVKKYGYKTPREMVENMEIFNVSVAEDKQTYFVEKRVQEKKDGGKRKEGIIKRRIHNYCIITADDKSGDYFFYMKEMNEECKDAVPNVGSHVDFIVVKEPNPNGKDMRTKNGKATDVKVLNNDN